MTRSDLFMGLGLGLTIAFASAGVANAALPPPPAAGLHDGVFLQSGGQTVLFTSTDDAHEAFTSLQALLTPAGFTEGTVYLTFPGEHDLFGAYSDAFTLVSTNGHIDVYFISDGASAAEQAAFVHVPNHLVLQETGKWQDVSAFFGQGPGFAQLLSDVPEPATWGLMLLGFATAGAALRSTSRRRVTHAS